MKVWGVKLTTEIRTELGSEYVGKRVTQTLDDLVIDLRQVFGSLLLLLLFKGNRLCSQASVPIRVSPG